MLNILEVTQIFNLDKQKDITAEFQEERFNTVFLHILGINYPDLLNNQQLSFTYKAKALLKTAASLEETIKKLKLKRFKLKLNKTLKRFEPEKVLHVGGHFFNSVQFYSVPGAKERIVLSGNDLNIKNDLIKFTFYGHINKKCQHFGYFIRIDKENYGYGYFYQKDLSNRHLIIVTIDPKDRTDKNQLAIAKQSAKFDQIFANQQEVAKLRFLTGPKI